MAKKRRRPRNRPQQRAAPRTEAPGAAPKTALDESARPAHLDEAPGNRASALCSRRTQGDGPTRTRAGAEGDRASERHPPRADDRRRGHRALRRRLPGLLQREITGRRIGPGTRGRRRGRMRRHRDAGRRGAGRHPPRIGRVRRIHGAPGDLGASRPSPLPSEPAVHTEPIREENAVHNLEHGYVILYYRADGPEALSVDVLARLAQIAEGQDKGLVAPYPDLEEGTSLAITAGTSCGSALRTCRRRTPASWRTPSSRPTAAPRTPGGQRQLGTGARSSFSRPGQLEPSGSQVMTPVSKVARRFPFFSL